MSSTDVQSGVATAPLTVDAANATRADLEVMVVDRAHDDQHFFCTVSSPQLEGFERGEPEEWILPTKAGEMVQRQMSEFTAAGVDGKSRMLSLKGAGIQLWEAAPERFKQAFEALVKDGRTPRTIQISSQERNIPWELMVPPFGAGDGDEDEPLGVRCAIARWFESEALRTPGTPADDARVAAPKHDTLTPLEHAEREADHVCTVLNGDRLDPSTPAEIEAQLASWSGTVLHFVGHGEDGEILFLDGEARLTANQVMGMKLNRAWSKSAPVVFLNACEAGRAAPTFNGAGGLVRSWVEVGAGAVIAPLWSVRDPIAHEVAIQFYNRIDTEPATPYADIMREIRAQAYASDEDSYASYCYFGSPLATAGTPLAPVRA